MPKWDPCLRSTSGEHIRFPVKRGVGNSTALAKATRGHQSPCSDPLSVHGGQRALQHGKDWPEESADQPLPPLGPAWGKAVGIAGLFGAKRRVTGNRSLFVKVAIRPMNTHSDMDSCSRPLQDDGHQTGCLAVPYSTIVLYLVTQLKVGFDMRRNDM